LLYRAALANRVHDNAFLASVKNITRFVFARMWMQLT
jgi:hypothetical protein